MAWTKSFRAARGKELTADSTFDFERRRDVVVKYDRTLMAKTVAAMQRINEIRSARVARLHALRMSLKQKSVRAQQRKVLVRNVELLSLPLVNAQRKSQLNKILNQKQSFTLANKTAQQKKDSESSTMNQD